MDIVDKARKLESKIARTLDEAVQSFVHRSPRQPIEIIHAIVSLAEQQIQPAGRGRRVFPFNRVDVHVAAESKGDRARFAVLADGPPALGDRIRERLQAARCEVPGLEVRISYASKAKSSWIDPQYHVEFERVEASAPPAAPAPEIPRLDLTITAGVGERRTYTFTGGRIDVGRRSEVVDERHRLVRMNHVVFKEGEGEANQSVSRRHAHIVFDQPSGVYRVHDDRSAHGTALVRTGQTILVPAGSRGVRLRDGDELLLGRAKLRVRITASSGTSDPP